MKEIIEKRNLVAKHFDNNDGTFTMDAHLGHIHYQNKQTKKLDDVDCKFLSIDYGWEMRKNNYELEIPTKADGWFKFINSFGYDSRGKARVDRPDEVVSIKPLGVSSVNGESITRKKWKGKGIVLYKDAYGSDIDLEVKTLNVGFVKEIVINKKPSDLSKDLEFAFEIDLGDKQVKPKKADYMSFRDAKLKGFMGLKGEELLKTQIKWEDDLERAIWNKQSVLETSDSIILEKLRKTWFREFNLYDSEGNQGIVKVRLENINGKIILTKVLDKRFLEKAIYPVRTDTTTSYYAGSGDGWVRYWLINDASQSDWDTCHDATAGIDASHTAEYEYLGISLVGSSNYISIHRGFFPINTNGLPDTAIISAAILKLYSYVVNDSYDDEYSYLAVVKTFQASGSELVTADYEDCGYDSGNNQPGRAKYLAVKGSADRDLTGLGTNSYQDFTLNETGRNWINKTGTTMLGLREGHDIQDNFPGDPGASDYYSNSRITFSEVTDTSTDPYLSVTYTVPAGAAAIMTTNKGYW